MSLSRSSISSSFAKTDPLRTVAPAIHRSVRLGLFSHLSFLHYSAPILQIKAHLSPILASHDGMLLLGIKILGAPMDFPGSPVVRTLCFHCRGHRFNPWLGEVLCAAWCGQTAKTTTNLRGIQKGEQFEKLRSVRSLIKAPRCAPPPF